VNCSKCSEPSTIVLRVKIPAVLKITAEDLNPF